MSATLVADSGHPDAQNHDNSLTCPFTTCDDVRIGIWSGDDSLAATFRPYVLVKVGDMVLDRFCTDCAEWLTEVAPDIQAVLA